MFPRKTVRKAFLLIIGILIVHQIIYRVIGHGSIFNIDIHLSPPPIKHGNDTIEIPSTAPAFAFIIQTEACLPQYWLTKEYIGNSSLCNCHVYIISYKRQCVGAPALSHLRYIFIAGVGWSKGRNTALFEARKTHNYIYYIFADDDVVLQYHQYTPTEFKNKQIHPLKIFTEFLLDYQPAGVGPAFTVFNEAHRMINRWHTVCKNPQLPRAIPVGHLDQCFVAYHRNTIDTVLPYAEKYDVIHFWVSAIYISLAFQVAFYGQLVYFPEIRVYNPLHRYAGTTADILFSKTLKREMVERLRQRTPTKYRNHTVFEMAYNYPYESEVHALCMQPPPARSPIIPYGIMPKI